MPKLFSVLSFVILFCACTKDNSPRSTFQGTLPITLTNSPSSVTAGENIISSVRCELTSISGSVYFKGFEIKEVASHHYDISAKALYENWNTQLTLPVMWTKDTSITIQTTTAGTYFLNFYNANQLFKSDTIEVN